MVFLIKLMKIKLIMSSAVVKLFDTSLQARRLVMYYAYSHKVPICCTLI